MKKSKIKLNPTTLTRFLAIGILVLASLNIIIQVAIYTFGVNDDWFLLFNMDKELNIPTLYSCILLFISSKLIKRIGTHEKKTNELRNSKWDNLSWIFLFLALDEGLQIHEIFIIPSLKPYLPTALSMIWVIPYGIFVIFASLYFLPLIIKLPKRIKYLIILAGIIYISGAIGMEIVGNALVRESYIKLHGLSYGLISTLEETLEMSGALIFIYSLLLYIINFQNQKIKINLQVSSREKQSQQISMK